MFIYNLNFPKEKISICFQETSELDSDCIKIQGHKFKLSFQGDKEIISEIQNRIKAIQTKTDLTLKELILKIKNVEESNLNSQELESIEKFCSETLKSKQETVEAGPWVSQILKQKTLKTEEELWQKRDALVSELEKLEQETIAWGNLEKHEKARTIYSLGAAILANKFKEKELRSQLKKTHIELLQNLFKYHQLSSSLNEVDEAQSRLDTMLELAIVTEYIA